MERGLKRMTSKCDKKVKRLTWCPDDMVVPTKFPDKRNDLYKSCGGRT